MSTTVVSATRGEASTDRYRAAERKLWDHYGLVPAERFVDVASPAVYVAEPYLKSLADRRVVDQHRSLLCPELFC